MQAPSKEHLVALLDQWSPQWKWRGRQRAIGAGAYEWYCTLGLYAFGGNAPNVSKASSMKEACMAINHFMRHRFPNGTWNSIAVLLNPRIGLHRDMQNMLVFGQSVCCREGGRFCPGAFAPAGHHDLSSEDAAANCQRCGEIDEAERLAFPNRFKLRWHIKMLCRRNSVTTS